MSPRPYIPRDPNLPPPGTPTSQSDAAINAAYAAERRTMPDQPHTGPTRDNCPTCGASVEIVTGAEGTSYFRAAPPPHTGEARVRKLTNELADLIESGTHIGPDFWPDFLRALEPASTTGEARVDSRAADELNVIVNEPAFKSLPYWMRAKIELAIASTRVYPASTTGEAGVDWNQRQELWDCFVASGADPDGADARHLNPGEALAAVKELHDDYREALTEISLARADQ